MTNKKFNHTQAVYFEAIANALEKANVPITYRGIAEGELEARDIEIPTAEVIDFLNYKIEQVNNRSKGKTSKASIENAEIAEKVFEYLTEHQGTPFTNGDLARVFEVNPQKMTPILKVLNGRIDRVKKGKSFIYGIDMNNENGAEG